MPPDARSSTLSPVTLAIVNVRAWTGDPRRPWADAIAIAGDRIAAVGSGAEVRKLTPPPARVIDGMGQLAAPGFIDSHIHFVEGGRGLASVRLRDAHTPAEFAERIGAHAATLSPGTWITGGDWDHERWGGELPRRDWIDAVTPENPVWVNRLDGHMRLANSLALRAAGVSRATADIAGGTIVRGPDGEPTGVLKDNAMELVGRAQPAPTAAMDDRALDAAMAHVATHGVTSVHHMGSWDDLAIFERAHAAGRLRTRIYAAVPLATWERLRERVAERGTGDRWLRIGGLKAFVDGSLGSHTAAFLEPFTDLPTDAGLLVTPPDALEEWTRGADAAGLHPIVHAIGDRAIRLQLDIFERVSRDNPPRDRRFRIEHAQHVDPADISRFGRLDVIASMQPYHAIDDGRWAERVIGRERARTSFAFRSLLDAGARIAFGSDWFVAPPTPLEGIYAAVTRRTLDGRNPDGWIPEEKIMVEEALAAYTREGAYASFEERDRGSLTRGKLADVVLIDRDLTRIPAESILEARVTLTVVGGVVVYEAAS